MVAAKDFKTPLEIEDVMDSLVEKLGSISMTNGAHEAVFIVNAEYDDEGGGIILEMSDDTEFIIDEVRKVGG